MARSRSWLSVTHPGFRSWNAPRRICALSPRTEPVEVSMPSETFLLRRAGAALIDLVLLLGKVRPVDRLLGTEVRAHKRPEWFADGLSANTAALVASGLALVLWPVTHSRFGDQISAAMGEAQVRGARPKWMAFQSAD